MSVLQQLQEHFLCLHAPSKPEIKTQSPSGLSSVAAIFEGDYVKGLLGFHITGAHIAKPHLDLGTFKKPAEQPTSAPPGNVSLGMD